MPRLPFAFLLHIEFFGKKFFLHTVDTANIAGFSFSEYILVIGNIN